jgi:farnesol dehydrogenase
MKVLVTGVTGFLGGRIAQRLCDAGHEVRGFARDPDAWAARPDGAEAHRGDLTDPASILRAAEGRDAVLHAAALVRMWVPDRREFDRVNVQGLGNVIEAVRSTGARLVYVSSFIALGPTDGEVFDEDSPRATMEFRTDYERTKWVADQMARHLGTTGASIVRLYPGVVFGPGPLTEGNHVVRTLLEHAGGRLPGILGDGGQRQCLAYVDDVADGAVRALETAPDGSGYVLGGENVTVRQMFEVFEDLSGVRAPRRRIPFAVASLLGRLYRWRAALFGVAPQLTDEVVRVYRHDWAYSSERACREIGYEITPFRQAMESTVAWMRREGHLE